MFAELVEKRTVAKIPVAEVIRRYPKQIVLSALLRMSEQAPGLPGHRCELRWPGRRPAMVGGRRMGGSCFRWA